VIVRPVLSTMLIALLAGCGAQTPPPRMAPVATAPMPAKPGSNLDRVLGLDVRGLVQMFGAARHDVREDGARKLQFGGTDCILDAYLYAPSRGREPVTTYVAARTPAGREAERNSCIAALMRQP
jgi:hypothetical protein